MSVYPYQLSNSYETVIMKLGMYIMAPEPISTAYFISPSIAARKRLAETLPRQQIHTQRKKNCWRRRLVCDPCHIKGK
jgi:hypothetical protein